VLWLTELAFLGIASWDQIACSILSGVYAMSPCRLDPFSVVGGVIRGSAA